MYNRIPDLLFSDMSLYSVLEAHIKKAQQKVDEIPREKFLASSDELIFEHVWEERFVHALVLQEDAMTMKDEEIQIEVQAFLRDGFVKVPGIKVTVSIPYTGDSNLWTMRPSSSSSVSPYGNVRRSRGDNDGILDVIIEQAASDPQEKIKNELDRNLGYLKDYITNQKLEIDVANTKLEPIIRKAIGDRRGKLGRHDEIVKMLGIPLERKEGAPSLKQIVLEKKTVKPLPSAPKEVKEYGISDGDYEHILSVIRHEGATFESTPKTYKGWARLILEISY